MSEGGYKAIAQAKAALAEHSGSLGSASVATGPQVVAKFFIAGFGDTEQRAAWLNRSASVAISEPRVGAHPKLLTTHADATADGYRISGEKAWVTNGPSADVFVVLAVTAVEDGRKRYSAFLVPRDTPGLTLKEMPEYRALQPSQHCGLLLSDCQVPHAALLGAAGMAYEAMALPFRDVEDAVGTFGLLGAFRHLLQRFGAQGNADEPAVLALGGMAALTAVFEEAADAVVTALDAGALEQKAAVLVGLRVLAAELLQRARSYGEMFMPEADTAIATALADVETSLSVARGPRAARQARLGVALLG
jgi:acyl-CoA dehydrogenase